MGSFTTWQGCLGGDPCGENYRFAFTTEDDWVCDTDGGDLVAPSAPVALDLTPTLEATYVLHAVYNVSAVEGAATMAELDLSSDRSSGRASLLGPVGGPSAGQVIGEISFDIPRCE